MLQACPEIHGNRADLNLYLGVHNAVRQKDRHRHNHVKALISANLGMLDIILDGNHGQIVLLANHLGKTIDIGCKGTDNSDSRNVLYIIDHILNRALVTIPF